MWVRNMIFKFQDDKKMSDGCLYMPKAMLIKESVLRPEIFQILSASQAKKTHRTKNTGCIRLNFVSNDTCIVINI